MCHGSRSVRAVRKERRKTIVSTRPASQPSVIQEAPPWVVVDFDRRGFRCERCGGSEMHSAPRGLSRLESFTLRGRAFAMDHANCEEAQS